MSEKAWLRVGKTKKGTYAGTVEFGPGKSMPLPPCYEVDERFRDAECDVDRESGQIRKVSVGGVELPRKEQPGSPLVGATKKQDDKGVRVGPPAARQDAPAPAGKSNLFLPADTRERLPSVIENFGLLLHKAASSQQDGGFRVPRDTYRFKPPLAPSGLFSFLDNRRKEGLLSAGFQFEKVVARPLLRLAVGLGQESVYESSIALHPVYGFPYVPASAVKGTVRNAVVKELFENNDLAALSDEVFSQIFGGGSSDGTSGRQGLVHFFDAFPLSPPTVAPDVATPHYAPYYQEEGSGFPPGDYYDPVPIFFLTVKDVQVAFYLGVKGGADKEVGRKRWQGTKLLDTAADWMRTALSDHGLGAKTSTGYGLMVHGSADT